MAKLSAETRGDMVKVPPFFKDRVIQRVLDCELTTGKKSGKPQFKVETEIVSPDVMEIAGEKYVLAGQKITYYLGLNTEVAAGARQSAWANTFEFLTKLGLKTDWDTDDESFGKEFSEMLTGVTFDNILNSQEDAPTKPDGKGGWTPILDARGKPIKNGFVWNSFLNNVIGKCEVETNRAY